MYRYMFSFSFSMCLSVVTSDVMVEKYLGCYRHFSDQILGPQTPVNQPMTIDLCNKSCLKNNSTFAGLQKGTQCLCGEDFNELVSEINCTKECSGNNSQYCGGTNEQSTAVYSVCSIGYFGIGCDKVCHCHQQTPCQRMNGKCPTGCDDNWLGQACDTANANPAKSEWYIGCYGDRIDRALDGKNNTVGVNLSSLPLPSTTTNVCLDFCAQYNYTYMGTQYSWNCFCGESYSRYGPSTGCTNLCSANRSQICGGIYANSVYSVCPTGSYSLNCLSRCNCFNGSRCIYRNGTCPAGCEPGWTGISCSFRDCNLANGGCNGPNELCETIDLKYATKTRCGCNKGFTRDKQWTNCTDIDECLDMDSFCGSNAYNCSNTIGSFVCGYCPEGQIVRNGSCFDRPTTVPKRGFEQNSKTGLIVGVVMGVFFALVIMAVVGIIICRLLRKGMTRKDCNGDDVVQPTTNSLPIDSASQNQYQSLDKTRNEIESPYCQLEDSIASNNNTGLER